MAIISSENQISPGIVETHPAMSWRSTIAGLLVSLFVFAMLLSLGIAMGGVSLTDGASLKNSGMLGGLWLLLSILLSLFAGSYFSARISNFFSSWVGMAQGAVLAALFLGVVMWQFVGFASWITHSAGALIGNAAQAGAQYGPGMGRDLAASMDLGVNDIIEDNLRDVQFKNDPTVVITGVASRILRGHPDSAKAYLARNTNLTVSEVDSRLAQAQDQLKKAGDDARQATASTLKFTGWSLFITMVLSLLVSIVAGVMGASYNQDRPAVRSGLPGFGRFRPVHTT